MDGLFVTCRRTRLGSKCLDVLAILKGSWELPEPPKYNNTES